MTEGKHPRQLGNSSKHGREGQRSLPSPREMSCSMRKLHSQNQPHSGVLPGCMIKLQLFPDVRRRLCESHTRLRESDKGMGCEEGAIGPFVL